MAYPILIVQDFTRRACSKKLEILFSYLKDNDSINLSVYCACK